MKNQPLTLSLHWSQFHLRSDTKPAIKFKNSMEWQSISWQDYQLLIEKIAAAFLDLGVTRNSKIAIMSNTRFEWGCIDMAAYLIGAVVVPVYQNNKAEELEYILNNSETVLLISENRKTLLAWRKISSKCEKVQNVVCFETDSPGDPSLITWENLIERGEKYLKAHPQKVKEEASHLKPSDVATLLYTSGTTGAPKGVVLTHEQIESEIVDGFNAVNVTDLDTSLAILPFAHVMGRIELWGHFWLGHTIAYAENLEKVRDNLKDIKPTILVAVPRVFEKIHAGIQSQIEGNKVKKQLFDWAKSNSEKIHFYKSTKQRVPINLIIQNQLADKLIFSRIREAFGGQLRFAISGGAPLNPEIARFFESCGILLLEGYGLTETTAAVTLNRINNYQFGCAGLPLGDVQLKIAEDGEVLVKSKKVMKEYYKNPTATNEAIIDGWFHTGDVGVILPSGHLKLTDRKKDLIKTSGGKYVAPLKIENEVKVYPMISHVIIIGDMQKYITALLAFEKTLVENFARSKNLEFQNWIDVLEKNEFKEHIKEIIAKINDKLSSWETIKKYAFLKHELTVENGELTTSMKVKRKLMIQKYGHLLDED